MARRLPPRTPAPAPAGLYFCAVVGYKLTQTQEGERLLTYVESHLTAFAVRADSLKDAEALALVVREKIKERAPGFHAWRVEVNPQGSEAVVTDAASAVLVFTQRKG